MRSRTPSAARLWPRTCSISITSRTSTIPLATLSEDKLVRVVADRLRRLVREGETVARMGADEFAIVQVQVAQPSDATALAQRVIEGVSEPYEIDGHQVVVGASVGISVSITDGPSSDLLLRNADLALYRAKSG